MMHRFRTLALGLGALGMLAAAGPAVAQTDAAPPPAGADSTHRMRKDPIARLLERREELRLTDEQASRLEAIRAKYQEKHQGHMEQLRRDRKARRAFRTSMDSARAEIAAVLTPEQQKQVEAMREEWRQQHRHGTGRREK
jgi:Spy/CpxP family protein refolding chaperone